MSRQKQVIRQRDFSAGELDDHGKRRDDSPMMRAGGRQMKNKRIMPTGAIEQRAGRMALFRQVGRTDEITLSPTEAFYLSFGSGTLVIRDGAGDILLNQSGKPWTTANVDLICWDRFENVVVICYPGMRPITLTYADGAWAAGQFTARITSGGQKRVPFYRFMTKGVTLLPSGVSGTINLTFSANYLTAGHVGTLIRYHGRQIEVATVTGPTAGTGIVKENLFKGAEITFATNPEDQFAIGAVIEGANSGAKGEIVAFPGGNVMRIARLSSINFAETEDIIGPTGTLHSSSTENDISPPASSSWDEEIMNDFRGWPRSVSVDQNRLIFTDFPGLPRGTGWSAIDIPDDFYPGANPEHALFELFPGAARVYHVIPGEDQFVFTSLGVSYIPISEANPLAPGSVTFRKITVDPVSTIRPASTTEGVLFLSQERDKVAAIRATGQTAKPYVVSDISEFHRHLLTDPMALVSASGVSGFSDRCALLLNRDGTVVTGKLDAGKEWVGWIPWISGGAGAVTWLSSSSQSVFLTTRYLSDANQIVERLDAAAMLDCQVTYNDPPEALEGTVGQGPLWFLAGATVYVMDGKRPMDTRVVDANGFLVGIEGEDLSSAALIAGFGWVETFEPFIPHAQEGRSSKQTLRKRKFGKIAVTAHHATGMTCANRTVPAWRLGDDRSLAPPLREETLFFKKGGRALDPRIDVVKDVPGQNRLIEFSAEVTV